MTETEARFLSEIRIQAAGRNRVSYDGLCRAFGQIFPAVTGLDQRKRLHVLLQMLATEGALTFPSGAKHYERSTEPSMPRWIALVSQQRELTRAAFDAATFPWVPELRFAAEIRSPQQLEVLRRVHEFLATGGAQRCHVPIKERSVELFGDEKKLDELRGGVLLRTGRLTLELLRCFQVSPPLVWEAGPNHEPRPVIIIENHCTYHSFTRWNTECGAWAAVCYGSGDCFESSAPSLVGVIQKVQWDGSLHYFGDLDPKGLVIPLRACKALLGINLPELQPAIAAYELLIERAGIVSLPRSGILTLPEEGSKWLGSGLASRVRTWFEKGIRLPQELVGFELLGKLWPAEGLRRNGTHQ